PRGRGGSPETARSTPPSRRRPSGRRPRAAGVRDPGPCAPPLSRGGSYPIGRVSRFRWRPFRLLGYHIATMRTRDGALKWSLVGPTLLLLVAFNVFPLLRNVVLSFTSAELVGEGSRFVGGAHYARVFTDLQFAIALRRTAAF